MRTNFKRFASLFMALVMSLSLLATTAFAYGYDIPDGAEPIIGPDNATVIGYVDADNHVVWFDNAPGNEVEPTWDTEDPVAADDNTGFTDEDLALVTSFKDVKTTAWYYKDVTECAKLGIVAGFEDGTFRPENHVTDVQWVTMVTRTFYNSDVETAQRSKPSGTPWYWANIKVGEDKYLCGTYGGVTISDKAMNRYDMARVTSNVVNTINGGAARPSDAAMDKVPSQVKDWSNVPKNRIMAIETCYATGLIAGMSDGKFHGEQSMTRAQACTVIMRMLKLINKYNPGDKDNSQYDDGKDQNTGNNNQQTQTGKLANGQEATVANVQAILDQIKREYPTGTSWGTSSTPGTNYYKNIPTNGPTDVGVAMAKYNGALSLKYACGGWMCMVSDRIFGATGAPAREITDITKARPGDIVVKMSASGGTSHVSIFLGYTPAQTLFGVTNAPKIITCDGNINGQVDWNHTNIIHGGLADIGTKIHILTRYPN